MFESSFKWFYGESFYCGSKGNCVGGSRTVLLLGRCAGLWSRSGQSSSSENNSCIKMVRNRSIGLGTRGRVYEAFMRSGLLYGAETWALTSRFTWWMFCADVIIGCWNTWQEGGGKMEGLAVRWQRQQQQQQLYLHSY